MGPKVKLRSVESDDDELISVGDVFDHSGALYKGDLRIDDSDTRAQRKLWWPVTSLNPLGGSGVR